MGTKNPLNSWSAWMLAAMLVAPVAGCGVMIFGSIFKSRSTSDID